MDQLTTKFFKLSFYLDILLLVLICTSFSYSNDAFAQKMFVEGKTPQLLPDFTDSYGVVFRDLNNDQLPDIYVVRFRNLNRFFINQGTGRPFEDFTIESGLGGNLMPRGQQNLELGTSSADFNNDGEIDISIAGWGISTRILKQTGELQFQDITRKAGITTPLDGNGTFWADINLDGDLDLFVTDEHYPNHLFLGDGRGNFKDVSLEWGIQGNTVSQGASFSDVDQDGYPDLYVCNWFDSDVLYKNMGGKRFVKQKFLMPHLTDSINSNGVTFGDVDNDGDSDLLVTDREGRSCLYGNETHPGDSIWTFTNLTVTAGLEVNYPSYGALIADLNNDGWQDIWINTIGPNMYFTNEGNGKFRKIFEEKQREWSPKKHYSTGAAVADMDLDGDLDLFVANKDTHSVLYTNPTDNQNFIQIQLTGVRSNRDAIGTKVRLYRSAKNDDQSKLVGYREVGGGGYLSQNELKIHFGINSPGTYHAQINFPAGEEKTMTDLQPGQIYHISENTGILKVLYRSYQFFYRAFGNPQFWFNLSLFLLLLFIIVGYTTFAMSRYQLAIRQAIIIMIIGILLLYTIFLILQMYPLSTRLLIQISILSGFLVLVTFFLEKIRNLELQRVEHRRLLQDFSQELIFIKENSELFQKLTHTIYQTIEPQYCVLYSKKGENFLKASTAGMFEGPEKLTFITEDQDSINQSNYDLSTLISRKMQLPTTHVFPIARRDKLFGILLVGPSTDKKGFTEEDLAIFRTLAAQAAIAIENNQYIEETKTLIQKVTEAETREKYIHELEDKNRKLQKLYKELQETQTQLVQSEKMASLGQLVAGVAHELNNPISYLYANMRELENYSEGIQQLLSVLKEDYQKPDFQEKLNNTLDNLREKYQIDLIQNDIKSLISESIEGSQRVKNVVKNLRNFSRLDEGELKEVNLHDGIESTLLLLNNEIKNRITVHKNYGDIPKVLCHPGNINQVFMNILLNAVQAIENQGSIWITTQSLDNSVEVEISDDGVGIPRDKLNNIFDPFFTTKQVGKGTGLGLSISYNIIQKHQGNISVESEEGQGSTFRITLPVQPSLNMNQNK